MLIKSKSYSRAILVMCAGMLGFGSVISVIMLVGAGLAEISGKSMNLSLVEVGTTAIAALVTGAISFGLFKHRDTLTKLVSQGCDEG